MEENSMIGLRFKQICQTVVVACAMTGIEAHAQDFPVGVGKAAPALVVSGWLRGEPVANFAKGHVYVVESWATWCQPCVASMPHLTQIQKEFGDKATVIGVDVWDQSQT